jgi:hypothetical protein
MADLNDDGLTDIVAAREDSTVSVLLGAGGGVFQDHVDYAAGREGQSWGSFRRVKVGDLNADGIGDLVVTDSESSIVTVLPGLGDGTFGATEDYAVGPNPYDVIIGDFNGDGWGDIVTANWEGKSLSFLLSNAGQGFLPRRDYLLPSAKPISLAMADFNSDGHLDLAISTSQFWSGNFLLYGTISVLLGNGDGSFQPRIMLENDAGGFSIAAADIDSDGILDLVCVTTNSGVDVRRGLGDGHFESPAYLGADGIYAAAGDLDNDGDVDIVLNRRGVGVVLINHGSMGFEPSVEAPLGAYWGDATSMIALGDVDQDGRLDVASTNTGSVAVLLNRWVDPSPFAASAFPFRERGPISVAGRAADVCFEIEPTAPSYENGDVDTATISLFSLETGTVYRIYSTHASADPVRDENHDGVPEIRACFSSEDMARVFSKIRGKGSVEVWLAGCLRKGGYFTAPLTIELNGPPRLPYATVTPNPSNPAGYLSITTGKAGRLVVTLYDVQGRLFERILDRSVTPSTISVKVGGDAGHGRSFPSGIYFYRIEAPDGVLTGRFAVVR